MNYLLDTNVCIALINGRPAHVRQRLQQLLDAGHSVFVSAIAVFELWYGVAKSARRETNHQRLLAYLAGPIGLLPFDMDDASAAGAVRATLERAGTPIGAYDVLMAGQALQRGLILVTANVAEFARIDSLEWEDWASDEPAAR